MSDDDQTYHLLAETGEQHELTRSDLLGLFADAKSWISFLAMSLGGPPAQMTARMENGERHTFTVSKERLERF